MINFYLLVDQNPINAFALPGGPVFITYALYSRLDSNKQCSGILGHEIGHISADILRKGWQKKGFANSLITGVAVG